MKILCLLQNGWGSQGSRTVFEPNPLNKSAKIMRKVVGGTVVMHFCNTNAAFTRSATMALPIDPKHVHKLVTKVMPNYNAVIVCGNQALKAMTLTGWPPVPVICMPHPASRSLRNTTITRAAKALAEAVAFPLPSRTNINNDPI